VHSLIV